MPSHLGAASAFSQRRVAFTIPRNPEALSFRVASGLAAQTVSPQVSPARYDALGAHRLLRNCDIQLRHVHLTGDELGQ